MHVHGIPGWYPHEAVGLHRLSTCSPCSLIILTHKSSIGMGGFKVSCEGITHLPVPGKVSAVEGTLTVLARSTLLRTDSFSPDMYYSKSQFLVYTDLAGTRDSE